MARVGRERFQHRIHAGAISGKPKAGIKIALTIYDQISQTMHSRYSRGKRESGHFYGTRISHTKLLNEYSILFEVMFCR